MREFEIPMIDQSFILYIGEDEFPIFAKKAINDYPTEYNYSEDMISGEPSSLNCGATVFRLIWLGNSKDDNLIYHEISHMLHYLFKLIVATEENEFKAYLSAWIHCEVFKYIKSINTKKNRDIKK